MPPAAPDLSHSQNSPASPLATPFSQKDPFQPSTRCLSLRGTVADFDPLANQRQRPDHEGNSADCTIDGPDELTSHRRAIIACHSLSWPDCAIARPASLAHAPHSTSLRARFGPCPVSGLYSIQRLLFTALGRPGGGLIIHAGTLCLSLPGLCLFSVGREPLLPWGPWPNIRVGVIPEPNRLICDFSSPV